MPDTNDAVTGQPGTIPPQRQHTPPFEALRVFDAVGRLGGIRKAAAWLDRDHAVISRHLRTLETWLGTKLIERSAQGSVLTPAGREYHVKIALALDAISHATLDLLNQGNHTSLTIHCAPGFALLWLSGRLEAFEEKNPEIDILLQPAVKAPDFAAHEADAYIAFNADYEEQPSIPGAIHSQTLAHVPIISVASPDYLDKAPPIASADDLKGHSLLHEDSYEAWQNWLLEYGVRDVEDLSGPRLSQGHLTLEAARRGRGVALANLVTASRDFQKDQLRIIGTEAGALTRLSGRYDIYMRSDRWSDRIPRRFRQWLKREIKKDVTAANKYLEGV
ncbi:MAG: LysR substrate-binding domain-containing protein [Pseudomonadota bacterium]